MADSTPPQGYLHTLQPHSIHGAHPPSAAFNLAAAGGSGAGNAYSLWEGGGFDEEDYCDEDYYEEDEDEEDEEDEEEEKEEYSRQPPCSTPKATGQYPTPSQAWLSLLGQALADRYSSPSSSKRSTFAHESTRRSHIHNHSPTNEPNMEMNMDMDEQAQARVRVAQKKMEKLQRIATRARAGRPLSDLPSIPTSNSEGDVYADTSFAQRVEGRHPRPQTCSRPRFHTRQQPPHHDRTSRTATPTPTQPQLPHPRPRKSSRRPKPAQHPR